MRVKVHDSGERHSPEERFTVATEHRVSEVSVSFVELYIEGYGPTELEAAENFKTAATRLIEQLSELK